MLHLNLKQCMNATKHGHFSIHDLNLDNELSYEDIAYIADYIEITPLNSIDLSIQATKNNVYALDKIGVVIGKQLSLQSLKFEITHFDFRYYFRNTPVLGLFEFIDRYRLKQASNHINKAIVNMVQNKPMLKKLVIRSDIEQAPLNQSQSLKFSQALQMAPIHYMELHIGMDKGAKLPIVRPENINKELTHFYFRHALFAGDVLVALRRCQNLEVLLFHELIFQKEDCVQVQNLLKTAKKIHTLSLSHTNLGHFDSTLLFSELLNCLNIKYLDLSSNSLSILNTSDLCDYISNERCMLLELDISDNTYTIQDGVQLAKALKSNLRINKLIINKNYFEDEGIQALISTLKLNHTITSINISDTFRAIPSDKTIKELCALISSPECTLKELIFKQTMNPEQLILLKEAILKNSSLRQVEIRYAKNDIHAIFIEKEINQHVRGIIPLFSPKNSDSILEDYSDYLTIDTQNSKFFRSDSLITENPDPFSLRDVQENSPISTPDTY